MTIDDIVRFYTPFVCIFGIIGNLTSLLVFCRRRFSWQFSSTIYLAALAVSDSGFLVSLLALWLDDLGFTISSTPFTCPLIMYLGQITCFLSVYFTVAFTIERFFAVCYPLRNLSEISVGRGKKIILGLTIFSLGAFSYVWIIARPLKITWEEEDISSESLNVSSTELYESIGNTTSIHSAVICSVGREHIIIASIASYIDSFFTLILPFLIIVFMNTKIALTVWRVKKHEELVTTPGDETRDKYSSFNNLNVTNQPPPNPNRELMRKERIFIRKNRSNTVYFLDSKGVNTKDNRHQSWNSAQMRVTRALLLVSSTFVLLNLPSHLVRAINFVQYIWSEKVSRELQEAQQFSNLLFYSNFSINFVLYCLNGKSFRNSLRGMLMPSFRENPKIRRVVRFKMPAGVDSNENSKSKSPMRNNTPASP